MKYGLLALMGTSLAFIVIGVELLFSGTTFDILNGVAIVLINVSLFVVNLNTYRTLQ